MKQTLRITFLHYAAPPIIGGVESVLAHQADAAAAAGHTVSVITGVVRPGGAILPCVTCPWWIPPTRPSSQLAKQMARGVQPSSFATLTAQIERELDETLRVLGTQVLVAHNVASLAKSLPLTAALHTLSQRPGAPGLVLWHHDLAWSATRDRTGLFVCVDLLRRDWPWVQQVAISRSVARTSWRRWVSPSSASTSYPTASTPTACSSSNRRRSAIA